MPLHFKPKNDKRFGLLMLLWYLVVLGRTILEGDIFWTGMLLVVLAYAAFALRRKLPRAIEVWPDRVCVVMSGSKTLVIPYTELSEVRRGSGIVSLFRPSGVFVISGKNRVELRRLKKSTVMLNPEQPIEFIAAVELARARAGSA